MRNCWWQGGWRRRLGGRRLRGAERQAVAGVLSYPLEQWGRRLREVQVEAGAAVRAGEVCWREVGELSCGPVVPVR